MQPTNFLSILRILLVLFFLSTVAHSQITTTGKVLDAISKEPLMGVSVFYDGTTIGVITDLDGNFSITTKKNLTAPLVISYIGFKNKIFNEPVNGSMGTVLMEEAAVQLSEVVLKPDTWSREKKLRIFKRQFLGSTPATLECRILNEEDIRLYYNSEKKILYAYAHKPILIKNKFMGYNLQYHLEDFEVRYRTSLNGFNMVHSIYYAGTAQFMEMGKKVKRKYRKNRKLTYYGSILHFMRALGKKKLKEEKFRIFKEKLEVDPYTYLLVTPSNKLIKVEQTVERLNILYDKWSNSYLVVEENPFYIDEFGNHSPPENILFGGNMGMLRVANVLPLDYNLNVTD